MELVMFPSLAKNYSVTTHSFHSGHWEAHNTILDLIVAILNFRYNCSDFQTLCTSLAFLHPPPLVSPFLSLLSPYLFYFYFEYSLVAFYFLVVSPFLLDVLPTGYHKSLVESGRIISN